MEKAELSYTAAREDEGRRLLHILRGPMAVSWSAVKAAKWSGRILVNGEPAHTDALIRAGDRVTLLQEEQRPVYRLKPYALPLNIVYEDEALWIIDKPAGLASQSSRNHPDDSLENALFSRMGCPDDFIYRPVNRLDRGTGGLMAAARTAHVQHLLQQMLHTPAFRRRYLALTDGVPEKPEGVLDYPIGKAPGATVRRMVTPEGKPSVTRYRVAEVRNGKALIALELETGRTHQIRVHLSAAGCPVHGDFLYGKEDPEGFPGCFALHSACLELTHPLSGKSLRFLSLPPWAGETAADVLSVDFH